MVSQVYASALPEYFTNFRRGGEGLQGVMQRIYPKVLIDAKEKYFGWVQSLYVTNLLANAGLLNTERLPSVAIVGSGLPFLEHELGKDNIRAVSIDPNPNLAQLVEKESSLRPPICSDTVALPLQDGSVNIAASHTYMQKLPSIADARATVNQMLRIATDYVVIQVTPKDHLLYRGDKTHRLALTTKQWHGLISGVVGEYGRDWHIREVHTVKIADAIPIGRPPVFVLERGHHAESKKDLSRVRHSTRLALIAEEEMTIANAISASRPALAAYVLHELEGIAQSLSIGGVMLLDAVDGIVARKFGPSPLGKHVDRIADHLVAAISYFSLGYPIFGAVNAARDLIVDAVALKVDENSTSRRTAWSRYSYGIVKGATFMIAPISHATGEVFAVASTAFSFYRAADLLRSVRKTKKR